MGLAEGQHALSAMRTAKDDGIPFSISLWRHVAQIGDTAVQDPSSGAVESWRMTVGAAVRVSESFSAFNRLLGGALRRRLRHSRDRGVDSRHRHMTVELEGEQSCRPIF